MRAILGAMGAARKITVEEWAEQLDDKDFRELVDGVLEDDEMPALLHDIVMTWLIVALFPYFQKRRGFVVGQGPKLVIRPDRGRVPDAMCFASSKFEKEGLVRTPPDIVIEIISPRPRDVRRDRIDKLADYAEMGVKQYWLVDPKVRTFEIFQLGPKRRYTSVAAASSGKLRRIPTFPGLVIDVDALWAEVDRIG
jgi:Uma2 family endonuclease